MFVFACHKDMFYRFMNNGNVIAEVLICDTMALTEQAISNDKQIKAVKQAFDKLATDA